MSSLTLNVKATLVSPLGLSGLVGVAVILILFKSSSGGFVSGFVVTILISAAASSSWPLTPIPPVHCPPSTPSGIVK